MLVYCDQASPGHQPGSVWGEMGTWSRPLGTGHTGTGRYTGTSERWRFWSAYHHTTTTTSPHRGLYLVSLNPCPAPHPGPWSPHHHHHWR